MNHLAFKVYLVIESKYKENILKSENFFDKIRPFMEANRPTFGSYGRKSKRKRSQCDDLPPAKKRTQLERENGCPIDIQLVNQNDSRIKDFVLLNDLKGLLEYLKSPEVEVQSHENIIIEKLALKNTSCIHTAKIVQLILNEKSPKSSKLFEKAILSNRSSLR